MSGASTEPCRGRRIPGLARCTVAMKRGQQLHPSGAPGEPQSRFPGTVSGAVPGLVVDVSAVRRAQRVWTRWSPSRLCRSFLACAACSSTRLSTRPSLTGCSTSTRWSISLRAGRAVFKVPVVRRQSYPTVDDRRENSRDPTVAVLVQAGRCPCCGRSCVVLGAGRGRDASPTIAPSRNSLRSRFESASRQCGKLHCSALFIDRWSLRCRRWRRAASE